MFLGAQYAKYSTVKYFEYQS